MGQGYDPGEFTETLEGTVPGEIVGMGKEKIEFRIRRKQKRIRRPPTNAEKKQSGNRDKQALRV